MAILGRNPAECLAFFEDHIRQLVARTLTPAYLDVRQTDSGRGELAFRKGDPVAVPIETKLGRVFISLVQVLGTIHDQEAKRYRLTTLKYWYRLQWTEKVDEPAFMRWEYDRHQRMDGPPRHHMHLAAEASCPGAGRLSLGKMHLPTGRVTIEELIRYCITELGTVPPCGDSWPEILTESERAFHEAFAGGNVWPAADR